MERPGALAPGQIDRRAGRPPHELERSESEWSARAPWRPDKSTGVPVARDMSLSKRKRMERPGALAPGQIDRRAGRPRHELERSESEWSARAPWRPDKSTGVPVARDMSLSAAKANGAPGRLGARTNRQACRSPAT